MLAGATAAMAAPRESDRAFQAPSGWLTNTEGELVEAQTNDGAIHFLIVPIEHRKMAEAVAEAIDFMRNRHGVTVFAKTVQKETAKIQGAEAHTISWEGKLKEQTIEIHHVIFTARPNELVLAAYWATPEALGEHRRDVDRMLKVVAQREAPERER
jgi:hypothetical protein